MYSLQGEETEVAASTTRDSERQKETERQKVVAVRFKRHSKADVFADQGDTSKEQVHRGRDMS